MSGAAGGLILLPLAAAALPLALGGLAIYGLVKAISGASSAASRYEQEQRARREAIRQSGVENRIGNFRADMLRNMNEQQQANIRVSGQMMQELEQQRLSMQSLASDMDPERYREYVSGLKASMAQVTSSISLMQDHFVRDYQNVINQSMALVSTKINSQYDMYVDELRQMQNDAAAHQNKAREFADSYIEEAKTLILALREDFEGEKFVGKHLASLTAQLNQAITVYNNGAYEAAIATAKDVAVNTLRQIYDADLKKQEWDNYYKLALVLSEEVKTYIESQETITDEIKKQTEEKAGKPLEDDIVGIRIADYSDKNSQGQNKYDSLLAKTNEVYATLRASSAEGLSTEQLKDIAKYLNETIYPAATECIQKSIINMNNAFSRQAISAQIIDFFEDHNFMYNGYSYDNDCHDKALHIGMENEATGEELIITLAPELLESGDIQTHVDLLQTKGDPTNEEKKAYFRQCIVDIVKGSNPYAVVDIQCNKNTLNQLASDNGIRERLGAQ